MVLATSSITTDPFVGRRSELAKLRDHIDAGRRLVTVVGRGGTGKTRLVQEFVRELRDTFEGGVWFTDLTEADDLEGVFSAVAAGLGVYLGERAPARQLGRAMRGRGRALFIFDNFEQVLTLAPNTVDAWSLEAPEALFIVTSRRPLELDGEHVLRLGPMPPEDGLRLFNQRRTHACRDFSQSPESDAQVTDIVDRLDGLPLAIELAAASMRAVGVFTLAAGLQVGTPGKDTLGNTLRWSWGQLTPPERLALAQSAVFQGGFTLTSAEAVIHLDAFGEDGDVMEALEGLADHNLIRILEPSPGVRRSRLYVSVRRFAQRMMKDPKAIIGPQGPLSGPMAWEALTNRHSAHYATLGRTEQLDALHRHGGDTRRHNLGSEIKNLLAGAEAALRTGDVKAAAGCALAGLAHFEIAGPLGSGRALATRALSPKTLPPPLRVRLLIALGNIMSLMGDADDAEAALEQAVRTAYVVGLRRDGARAESALGEHCRNQGRIDEAMTNLEGALAAQRHSDDPAGHALTLNRLGNLLALDRDLERVALAQGYYTEALAIAQGVGDRRTEGRLMSNLGSLHLDHGRMDDARRCYESAVSIAREIGDRRGEGIRLANLGGLLTESGATAEALPQLERALRLAREIGDHPGEALALTNLGEAHLTLGNDARAEACLRQGMTAFEDLKSPYVGAGRIGLAALHTRARRFPEARRLLDAAEPPLRDYDAHLYCKLWCRRAENELAATESGPFRAALKRAEDIALDIDVPDNSTLGRALKTLRHAAVGIPKEQPPQ